MTEAYVDNRMTVDEALFTRAVKGMRVDVVRICEPWCQIYFRECDERGYPKVLGWLWVEWQLMGKPTPAVFKITPELFAEVNG